MWRSGCLARHRARTLLAATGRSRAGRKPPAPARHNARRRQRAPHSETRCQRDRLLSALRAANRIVAREVPPSPRTDVCPTSAFRRRLDNEVARRLWINRRINWFWRNVDGWRRARIGGAPDARRPRLRAGRGLVGTAWINRAAADPEAGQHGLTD